MKRAILSLLSLSMVFAAAGCSAKQEAEGSNPGIVEEVDGTSTEEMESPAFTESAQALQDAFQDAGYTLSDIDLETDELSFKASGTNGVLEVEAHYYATVDEARAAYKSNNTDLNNDGYSLVTAYSADGWEISETMNNELNYYALSGVMDKLKVTYEIEDILEGDIDSALKVLESLGFTPES
jgi:hypothetical protein